jgi:hypothetical protein
MLIGTGADTLAGDEAGDFWSQVGAMPDAGPSIPHGQIFAGNQNRKA